MFKVPWRRKLNRGGRFDAPLTGLSLVELRAPCGAWSSRARLRFSRHDQSLPARSSGRAGEPIRRTSEDGGRLVDRGGYWRYLATGRGDYFPVRLDRFFVAHDRFHFTGCGVGGWEFFRHRFVRGGLGDRFRSGSKSQSFVHTAKTWRRSLARQCPRQRLSSLPAARWRANRALTGGFQETAH